MHQLHHCQATSLATVEEDLSAFGEGNECPYGSVAAGGHVAQTGQTAIDENPLTVVEVEVAHRKFVFCTCFFVGYYQIVRMPT